INQSGQHGFVGEVYNLRARRNRNISTNRFNSSVFQIDEHNDIALHRARIGIHQFARLHSDGLSGGGDAEKARNQQQEFFHWAAPPVPVAEEWDPYFSSHFSSSRTLIFPCQGLWSRLWPSPGKISKVDGI